MVCHSQTRWRRPYTTIIRGMVRKTWISKKFLWIRLSSPLSSNLITCTIIPGMIHILLPTTMILTLVTSTMVMFLSHITIFSTGEHTDVPGPPTGWDSEPALTSKPIPSKRQYCQIVVYKLTVLETSRNWEILLEKRSGL